VLLTGHTGFKGAWLSLWLQSLGARVTGYALDPPSSPNLFQLTALDRRIDSRTGDLRDLSRLQAVLADSAPDVVLHLGAQSLVRRSYEAPVDTFATNVMGTVHLLEAVRRVGGVKAVVIVTSDKCYENQEWLWGYRESEPMGGHDPYSSSKGCAELVTAAFRRSFFAAEQHDRHGTAVASARAGNVIGGGDWAEDRLVPDLVRAFCDGRPVTIRNPVAIRPWQHVLDPLAGYLLLAERLVEDGPAFADAWNFGPAATSEVAAGELARRVQAEWGSGEVTLADAPTGPHEACFLKLDSSKAIARLGWRPRLDLPEAVSLAVDWYRKVHADPSRACTLTLEQIHHYAALGAP
jgi:CDP-glucose 4,6-dehydratase